MSAATGPRSGALTTLFEAVNGLRNGKALAATLACTVAGVLLVTLLMASVGSSFGPLAPLLALIVWFVAVGTGFNAAGLLHMDTARGISPRSLGDALTSGLMCVPKLIVLALAALAIEIAVFIAVAILLFICRIPWLGPLLYTIVFPLSVVLIGVTLFALLLVLVLSLPAIWQGAAITRALAQTLAIVRSRFVESLLLLFVVGLLAFAVGAVVFSVLGAGLLPTIALSASIVGFGGFGGPAGIGALGGIAGMSPGLGGGHALAGAVGGMLLWAVAVSLVAQVWLLGLCLLYLRVTEGLDLTAAEATLRSTIDEARRRTSELGERALAATRPAGAQAAAATSVAATPTTGITVPDFAPLTTPVEEPITVSPPAASPDVAAPPATADIDLTFELAVCPQCLSQIVAKDVFCGVCGFRLG